jgi:CRISPR-associated protein Csm5
MSEKTKLKITTITPVTIGSGAELSPYCDYIVDNDTICFINKRKLQEIIAKNDRWLDLYVAGIVIAGNRSGQTGNRNEFDLKNFLLHNRIVRNLDDVISSKRSADNIVKADKLPIKAIVKSPLQEPYFPGSSIKGALKTVLMYNWLKTDKKADMKIEEAINGRFENGKNKEVNFDWLEKEFEYRENERFSSAIQQVTDSKMLNRDSNIVVDCRRKVKLRLECIRKNVSTEFELVLEGYRWKDLAKQANDYASDCLDRERDLIEADKKLIHYYNRLVDIQDLINDESDKNNSGNVAYFRVGFGKGYYLNSLGIAIYDYVQGKDNLYRNFESFLKDQFAKRDVENDFSLEEFPRTRLMVNKTQEPLGWIKIEKT